MPAHVVNSSYTLIEALSETDWPKGGTVAAGGCAGGSGSGGCGKSLNELRPPWILMVLYTGGSGGGCGGSSGGGGRSFMAF